MKIAELPLPVEWRPQQIAGGWVDCFQFRISAQAGLPPTAQARILRVLINRIAVFRAWFYLWVELEAPGTWYAHELQRLVGQPDKLVITPRGVNLRLADLPPEPKLFEKPPTQRSSLLPNFRDPKPVSLSPSVLRVLQTLARLESAQTLEIASLAGFSKSYTHTQLQKLEQSGYVRRDQVWKYPGWRLTRAGLLQVHRSWQLPPKVNFRNYRREHSRAGGRHRRVARLWRAWLTKAYPGAGEIWACWTEFAMHPGFPDALAWGTWRGQETLFWLEVETGHASRQKLRLTYEARLHRVSQHAERLRIPIILAVLSLPWVLRTVVPIFTSLPPHIAVIAEDWRRFGELPIPEFGECRVDFNLMKEHPDNHIRRTKQDWGAKFERMRCN